MTCPVLTAFIKGNPNILNKVICTLNAFRASEQHQILMNRRKNRTKERDLNSGKETEVSVLFCFGNGRKKTAVS